MATYKLLQFDGKQSGVLRDGKDSIPFCVDNNDYANFKKEVLAGAELQDADGNVMTQADDFIATLP